MKKDLSLIQQKKNKQYTHNWRKRVGNVKRSNNYKLLTETYHIPTKQARTMRFWSDSRIEDYLITNGYKVVGSDG